MSKDEFTRVSFYRRDSWVKFSCIRVSIMGVEVTGRIQKLYYESLHVK